MRQFLSKPVVAIIATGIFFLIASFTHNNTTRQYSLFEAISNNTVTANASSNGKYSGRSVEMNLVNNTGHPLQILIPAGTRYLPEDDGEQTLIQMEDRIIALKPNGNFRGQMGAFCTEAHDRCPSESSGFSIAQNKDPKFDKLFAYMKGKTISKTAYQDAVWAISDGYNVANIATETPADAAFRKQVASISGQKDTWYTSPQNVRIDENGNFNMETVKISGELSFTCPTGTKVRQDIHRGNGDVFYASDKTMTAQASSVHYSFHLSVLGWEKGTYYIRIHDGTKELGRYEFTV